MPIVQLANTLHSPRALGHWTAQSLTGSCHLSLASISQPTLDMEAGGSASNNTCPSQICKAVDSLATAFLFLPWTQHA